ncbi:MAG TPA: MFS transporter [Burkholderiales bacterium]|jgi:MFS family permease|nr:MFS transporter [Burkholderiales bacterium]
MGERWKILAALVAARVGMGFQFQAIACAAPFLVPDLGLDKTQLGWLIGLYMLPGIFIALPGGLLGARFGDKRMVLAGLALMIAGALWLSQARDFGAAAAARGLAGVGAAVLNVLLTKMVADWFDGRDRLLAMSILINCWPIGIALALFLLGPVSEASGWPFAAACTAALPVAGFLAVGLAYRAPPGAAQAGAGLGLGALTRPEWRLLVAASLPWMIFNAGFQILVSFLPAFFLERGLTVAGSGASSALTILVSIFSVQAGGILLKRMPRPDVLCHGAIAAWLVTTAFFLTGDSPLAWLLAGSVVIGLPAGLFVSLPAEVLRPELRAAGMGFFYTVFYVGVAVFPALAGALYDLTGHAASTLWLAAGCVAVCVPALLLLRALMRSTIPAPVSGEGRR